MKEHIYKENKIIEYSNNDFMDMAMNEDGDVSNKHFTSIENAKNWLDINYSK